jgi:hypothetical protein
VLKHTYMKALEELLVTQLLSSKGTFTNYVNKAEWDGVLGILNTIQTLKCVLLRCSPSYKCESLQRCLLEQQNGVENVDLQHKTLK